MHRKLLWIVLVLILSPLVSFSMLRQQYGGNIRIADDLINALENRALFQIKNGELQPLTPLPYKRESASIEIDLKQLDSDQITEIKNWVSSLNDSSNSCHWIRDYPYFDHQHPTTMAVEGDKLTIASTEEEYLDVILTTSCLLPPHLKELSAFQQTQFGYEANLNCISGRPFLDSISPVQVDAANPYLSLKLNDVDVAEIPEERFNQINGDASIAVINGPSFYVYLLTSGLSAQQVDSLIAAIDVKEIQRAVLNDHAETLVRDSQTSATAKIPPIYFSYPQENPYRLIAERLRYQWESRGFAFASQSSSHSPQITLQVARITEQNMDAFRYLLLSQNTRVNASAVWFEEWERLESAGTILPLLIHHSEVAVRKNIQDLHPDDRGMPDFANCWIFQ